MSRYVVRDQKITLLVCIIDCILQGWAFRKKPSWCLLAEFSDVVANKIISVKSRKRWLPVKKLVYIGDLTTWSSVLYRRELVEQSDSHDVI